MTREDENGLAEGRGKSFKKRDMEKRKEIINSDGELPDATLNASDRFDALVHIMSPLALLLIPVICFCWF